MNTNIRKIGLYFDQPFIKKRASSPTGYPLEQVCKLLSELGIVYQTKKSESIDLSLLREKLIDFYIHLTITNRGVLNQMVYYKQINPKTPGIVVGFFDALLERLEEEDSMRRKKHFAP